MNVFVRADASPDIGTGHVMRCLALGRELADRGATLTFVMRDPPPAVAALVRAEGFGLDALPEPGSLPADDAAQTAAAMSDHGQPDWLIVDHYGVDERWQDQVRPSVRKIMVIDDLARHKHACDLLLNQNLIPNAAERYRTLVPHACETLLGPRFALLRAEFAKAHRSLRRQFDRVANVLVFLGGGDPDGVTLKVLAGLQEISGPEMRVTTVAGAANAHRSAIERLCAGRPGYRVLATSGEMATLMAESDLAIGAGGISIWERCCLGLPAIVIGIAENQYEVSERAAEAGVCLYLGRFADFSPAAFSASLKVTLVNSSLRHSMSLAGTALVDGLGCGRVVKAMLREPVHVRPARADDAERVFPWRNAVETRRHSHDPRPLSLDKHVRWFNACLIDAHRQLLIGESTDGPVGVLRYDFRHDVATVSIYLNPAQHGRGYGASLLSAGEEWLRRTKPNIVLIRAEILRENKASRTAFAEAGFAERGAIFEKSLEPRAAWRNGHGAANIASGDVQ
jgi:UDP-2,4-diacetamido-2,4,6-trideoxy-beta-L-altropyranose hydrolase